MFAVWLVKVVGASLILFVGGALAHKLGGDSLLVGVVLAPTIIVLLFYCGVVGLSIGLDSDNYDAAKDTSYHASLRQTREKRRQRLSHWIGAELSPGEAAGLAEDLREAPGRAWITKVGHGIAAIILVSFGFLPVLLIIFVAVVSRDTQLGLVQWKHACLLGLYAVMSLVAYKMVMGDKAIARRNALDQEQERRISELTLHTLEMLGGFIGSFVAQRRFHHKTKSLGYQISFWLIVLMHVAMWVVLLCFGGDELVSALGGMRI
jgi:uncharacterized membrane protein YsdA (DUF1294 family)